MTLSQGLGTTETYALLVVDGFGQVGADETDVSVVDSTPPQVGSVVASPATLWPPNKKMVGVTVAVEADDVCGTASCAITNVTSNEAIAGDWQLTGPLTALLRAERAGKGDGRRYTLEVACLDPTGNGTSATATVLVPHDRR